MTRPAGVTASAVVAIIGSVLTLVFAGLMFVAAYVPEARMPPNNRGIVMWAGVAFIGLAALGTWTAVGLFRMRSWARTSILVFAGIMAALSLLSAVMISVIPFPPMPDATPNAPRASTIRWVMVAVYIVPLVIGVWWLVLFNKKSIRAAFANTAAPAAPGAASPRPLSISIIAWWNIAGGALSLIPAAMQMPAFIAGILLTGWSATLVYVFFAAVGLYLGWGLLKLDERARVLMIVWFALSGAHMAYIGLVPGARARMLEFERSLRIESTPPSPPPPTLDATTVFPVIAVFAVVFFAVAIWFLVRNKPVFLAAQPIEHE
jgi:hypothetical protein